MRARLPDPFSVDEQVLNDSTIREYADHSDTITSVYVRYLYFIDGLMTFMRKIGTEEGLNPKTFTLPIDWTQPIFNGSFYTSHTYPSTGILLMIIYLFPMIFSAFLILNDLRNKSLERSYVAGVKPFEVFIVIMIIMTALISLQVVVSMIVMYNLFDIPIDSSILQVFILLLLHGIEGVGTGLFFSLLLKDEIVIVGIVLPLLICSGVIWPSEAIPLFFRIFTDWTPITLPLESLRSLLFRRLTIESTRFHIKI
ncbi:unnamed protein product [Oppiella nova]|uniref:ABC-2 type transporter transmembrane domain-containing protein n=1 Tax=Oppiella nova TaxID=334625 RepID=A0A7R9LCU9_9ACAR|nr:unnamed protein product [Oppiella nova]CAG2161716.1 unnamed protein product [Oppiella nova]